MTAGTGVTVAAFPRPRLAVPPCLGCEPVRCAAQAIRNDIMQRLAALCDVVVVGPEVEIGRLGQVDGFVLKNRSPLCVSGDAGLCGPGGDAATVGKGPGTFGCALPEHCAERAVEDEGRLRDQAVRERFLTLLYALARLRAVDASRSRAALVELHAQYKYLLMACHQEHARALGRIVAGVADRPWDDVIAAYRRSLAAALARPAPPRSQANALMHAFGHVSGELAPAERAYFLEQLDELRAGRAKVAATLTLLRGWVLRFGEPYLERQACFRPYPRELDAA